MCGLLCFSLYYFFKSFNFLTQWIHFRFEILLHRVYFFKDNDIDIRIIMYSKLNKLFITVKRTGIQSSTFAAMYRVLPAPSPEVILSCHHKYLCDCSLIWIFKTMRVIYLNIYIFLLKQCELLCSKTIKLLISLIHAACANLA